MIEQTSVISEYKQGVIISFPSLSSGVYSYWLLNALFADDTM